MKIKQRNFFKLLGVLFSFVLGVLAVTIHGQPVLAAANNYVTCTICNSSGPIDAIGKCTQLELGARGLFRFGTVLSGEDSKGNPQYNGTVAAAFSLFTTEENDFYSFSYNNPFEATITFSIYDYNRALLAGDYSSYASVSLKQSESETFTIKLQKNSLYYIVASCKNSENYTPQYVPVTVNVVSDDAGDTKGTAQVVNFNRTYAYKLDGYKDVDFFKITTGDKEAYYKFSSWGNGLSNLSLTLYDSKMVEIDALSPASSGKDSTELKLSKNSTYYIEVSAGNTTVGTYKFRISRFIDDVKSTLSGAKGIAKEKAYKYAIQTSYDTDTFSFKTGSCGAYKVIVSNKSGLDSEKTLSVEVLDNNGNPYLSEKVAAQKKSTISSVTFDKDSTYYIRISGSDNINYSVKVVPVTCKITYYLNGGKKGKNTPSSYIVTRNTKLVAPKRSGYKFLGWYTSPNFRDSEKITYIGSDMTKDITLYANWAKK